MTETNYTLPPRKWYTLEQAAKRISKLTGEEIEIADLLHYWEIGKINLSVYFANYPAVTRITAHGLRSIASTYLNEQLINYDVIEACLSHIIADQTRKAYSRILFCAY